MITPDQIDAVDFGDIIHVELPGDQSVTGPVRDVSGLKVIGELYLTTGTPAGTIYRTYFYDGAGQGISRTRVATGYSSEWVMSNGTLTVLQRKTS